MQICVCCLSKPASLSFAFLNRLRQSFVIPLKAQQYLPTHTFPNITTGKSEESLHEP